MTKLLLQVVLFHLIRLCLCFENYQLGKLGAMVDLDQGGPNSLGGPNFSGGDLGPLCIQCLRLLIYIDTVISTI